MALSPVQRARPAFTNVGPRAAFSERSARFVATQFRLACWLLDE